MIKKIRFPKIFFGWWTVLVTGFLATWLSGYRVYGMSALFKPIASEFGFTRQQTSIPNSIGTLAGGIEGLPAGWLTDRFGPRLMIFSGVFIAGVSLLLMNYMNSFWFFLVVWGILLGTAQNMASSVPAFTAISNWFVKKRGLALGMNMVGHGLSGVLVLPLVTWLIITQGWRITCVIGGVVLLVVGLPLSWFLVKPHRPEYYGLLPDGAKAKEQLTDRSRAIERGVEYAAEVEEVEFTLRQAIKTPALYTVVIAQAIQSLSISVVNIHAIPLLTDMGIDPLRAATIVSITYVGFSIPARLAGGLLADRLKKNRLQFLLAGAYLMGALGFAFFLKYQTLVGVYIFFSLFGISKGVAISVFSAMLARYYGRKSIGSIRGFATTLMSPFSLAAPVYAGWVYDTTGSYISALKAAAALFAAAVALQVITRAPKPPARITGTHKLV